jgi:integrase
MANILPRKRRDGTIGYTVNIRIKRNGVIVHRESQTFDREQAAIAWMKRREVELAKPDALTKPEDPTLAQVITKYNDEKMKEHGHTKTQVLRTIQNALIAQKRCSEIQSQHIVDFAKSLLVNVTPQTVGNYMSHLAAVFTVAKPAWGYPLDIQAMQNARVVLKRMGMVSKSRQRERRPTLGELDRLLTYYQEMAQRRPSVLPMPRLIAFAIFSTRRQEEICRVLHEDLNQEYLELMVRDMKNPGEKLGNNVRTTLTPEALQLINSQTKTDTRIWPYSPGAVTASFTRACKYLGIEDLHFHDLRHDGISRLFELGWTIPQVAAVSGHRSWSSLKRYTHIKQTGDKYLNWEWFPKILSK